VESDPIGLKSGVNTYAYVGSMPIMYVDANGLCWIFSQSTGQWSHHDINFGNTLDFERGFSGNGAGYNNPMMQYSENTGPLPVGLYNIGAPHDWHHMPDVMDLTPVVAYQYGRPGGYKIHGAFKDPAKRAQSSNGCPIASKDLRQLIADSKDTCLQVVP
jgi:uncharacterized protein RhaS with RHS repeats